MLKNRERLLNLTVNEKQKNSAFPWRQFAWRGLTVLMFFYLCADVTVLEYFCGNPSLGIASYRQIVEINPQPAKASETSAARDAVDVSSSSKHGQEESDIPIDGDDCFCCSSHAVVAYNYLTVPLSPIVQQHYAPNFSNRQSHSNWHLPPSYRPPRTA